MYIVQSWNDLCIEVKKFAKHVIHSLLILVYPVNDEIVHV